MPEIRLDRPRVVPVVGELVAAGMPEHVGMRLYAQTAAMAHRDAKSNPAFRLCRSLFTTPQLSRAP